MIVISRVATVQVTACVNMLKLGEVKRIASGSKSSRQVSAVKFD